MVKKSNGKEGKRQGKKIIYFNQSAPTIQYDEKKSNGKVGKKTRKRKSDLNMLLKIFNSTNSWILRCPKNYCTNHLRFSNLNWKHSINLTYIVVFVYLGFVWIQLIFAETENWNWKHCNEIIFKYVNSAVWLIFNEKVVEKCNLWDLWTVHECTVHSWLINKCRLNKKKKKKKEKMRETQNATVDVESKYIHNLWSYMFFFFNENTKYFNMYIPDERRRF